MSVKSIGFVAARTAAMAAAVDPFFSAVAASAAAAGRLFLAHPVAIKLAPFPALSGGLTAAADRAFWSIRRPCII